MIKFGLDASYPQKTSINTNQVTNRERKLKETDFNYEILKLTKTKEKIFYQEAVGSLLYLSGATWPDISYTVNVLCGHQVNPTENDWNMVKKVFIYMKGTKSLGLRYL